MVAGFRRSLSFPKPKSPSHAPEKPYHVRSTSLPNRSHPSVFQIREQLQSLKSWDNRADKGTSAWLCAGLNQIKNLHHSLDDLLQLDQFQAPLRRRADLAEDLLDHSLRFVDAYGILRAALVGLKEEQLGAQVAIRRRDAAVVAARLKAQRKIQRELVKAVAMVREIGKSPTSVGIADGDAEVAGIVRDVNAATAAVSVAALCGVSAPSSNARTTALKSWVGLKRKQGVECGLVRLREFEEACGENLRSWKEDEKMALRRLEALEVAIVGIERESERVFRSLINTRVSLLNVLTQ
ncbi:hypothetical protein ACLOJK_002327 [Asimina triloba]